MHRNPSVNVHKFAMVPNSEVPRSAFRMQQTRKTTFDAGKLIPVMVEEVLPGDTFKVNMTGFVRMATLLFPFMDNVYLDSFFFFVPNRLVWDNWKKFMGEQANPADSIAYAVPTKTSPAGGYAVGELPDMMGLPTVGQIAGGATFAHNVLPLRGYAKIWNEWFRDQNLQNSVVVSTGDGPDTTTSAVLLSRGKRHDYFTSCLPWPQKGATAISVPLSGTAPIKGLGVDSGATWQTGTLNVDETARGNVNYAEWVRSNVAAGIAIEGSGTSPIVYADLSQATGATINALRQSFQIQKFLERDARGGTRYTEWIEAHFKVVSPDARLQRPEYLGGGTSVLQVNPIAQTSATGLTGGTTPTGNLAAMATGLLNGHGFHQSFTEHGYIIGLVCVRADITYQQGLRRHWSRSTRYDYYAPAFAHLGEQAVLNKEIYCRGDANDALTFGYQERWAEYRYAPSEICGLFRSTAAGTIDPWHLSQKFTALPTLGDTFIKETPPMDRVVAVTSTGKTYLGDFFFDSKVARCMPLYSVPGFIDRF